MAGKLKLIAVFVIPALFLPDLERPAFAAGNESDCSRYEDTLSIKDCLSKDISAHEARLKRLWKRALSVTRDKKRRKLLRKAQRAWMTQRDARCIAEADFLRGGTWQGVNYMSCYLLETKEQIKWLKWWVDMSRE